MKEISQKLTTVEYMSLEYVVTNPKDHYQYVITERARIAGEEIITKMIEYCLSNNVPIQPTKEEIIQSAFDWGVVRKLADIQAEIDAQIELENNSEKQLKV